METSEDVQKSHCVWGVQKNMLKSDYQIRSLIKMGMFYCVCVCAFNVKSSHSAFIWFHSSIAPCWDNLIRTWSCVCLFDEVCIPVSPENDRLNIFCLHHASVFMVLLGDSWEKRTKAVSACSNPSSLSEKEKSSSGLQSYTKYTHSHKHTDTHIKVLFSQLLSYTLWFSASVTVTSFVLAVSGNESILEWNTHIDACTYKHKPLHKCRGTRL